jgi:L-lactate dehydrogenase complex protein LldG
MVSENKKVMTSRERILASVSQNQSGENVLRAEVTSVVNYDLIEKFKETLVSIGGRVVHVEDESALHTSLLELFPGFEQLNTITPALEKNFPADPRTFSALNVAIIKGDFAVAENGAVWITDRGMGERVLPFICEHLVLIIKRTAIVATLHDAYERIGHSSYDFGTFIAGPSKTADIEQSLVLGAHGAKTMTVLLLA